MRVLLVASLCLLGATLAEDEPETPQDPAEARLRLEVDPHGLARELARVGSLARTGKHEDALALAEKLGRDPHRNDGLFAVEKADWRHRRLVSFDRLLRAKLLELPEATRKAFDARYDEDALHLAQQGRSDLAFLAQLVQRFPLSSRAPAAALELAERALETGDPDAAAAWLAIILDEQRDRSSKEVLARARLELPAALALAGRDGEAERVLDKLSGDELARARALLKDAQREREASAPPRLPSSAGGLAWAHDVDDWYEPDDKASIVPRSEPASDGERLYVQDGSHALALSLETGKTAWRASLRPRDEGFRQPESVCRVALGPTVVACSLPWALVALDRATGDVLYRLTVNELRKMTKIEDETAIVPSLVLARNVLVVPLEGHHVDDELTLVGLDARTGNFLWKVFIVGEPADQAAGQAVLASGPDAVYCLTNRGVVASIEPQTGGVSWLRRYASLRDARSPAEGRGGFRFRPPGRPEEGGGMAPVRDGLVAFVHGQVLAAPGDSKRVFAFDPRTGEDRWATDDEGAAVIGPWRTGLLEIKKDGDVVLVGRSAEKVTTLDEAKFSDLKLAGKPAISGDVVVLPFEGEIVRLDLAAKAARKLCDYAALRGLHANVACPNGTIVAVGPSRTVAFAERAPGAASAPEGPRASCRALGAPAFAVREAAFARLVELGEAARAELETASFSADPEVRLRALHALDEIARKDRVAAWKPRIKEEWLAEDAGLLDKLTHRNALVRSKGVRDLGRIADPDAKALLVDLLGDKDGRVAGHAAIALLEKDDRAGIALVGKLLDGADLEDRKAAIKALEAKGKEEDLPLLAKAVEDELAEVRGLAVAAALRVGGAKALPIATKAAEDKDELVRSTLESALVNSIAEYGAKLSPDLVCPIFAKLAHDPQRGIRERALAQLGQEIFCHRPEAIEAFAEGISDTDQGVQRKALEFLVNLKPQDLQHFPRVQVEKAFDQQGIQDNDRYHLVQIAEVFLEAGGAFALGPLARSALEAEHPTLRERALEVALARARQDAPLTAADVASLASLTFMKEMPGKDETPIRERAAVQVRLNAYQIAAVAHGPGLGRLLLRGLDDSDEDVRDLVKRALPAIADADVLAELLVREAASDKPAEQAIAALALDARADDKKDALAPVLIVALDDGDPRVRARAWKRVRDLAQSDEELGLFEPAASDAERAPAVRRAASWWWRHKHDLEPASIVRLLKGAAPAERWRAAKKLADLGAPCYRSLVVDALVHGMAEAAAAEKEEYVQRQELAALAAITGAACSVKEGASPEERARAVKLALEWRR